MSWVFFVRGLQGYFVEYALARRVAGDDHLIAVGRGISVKSSLDKLPLARRVSAVPGIANATHYLPLHFPTRVPVVGQALQRFNIALFRREMKSLGLSRPLVVCYDSPSQQHLAGILKEDLALYYVSDDFTVTLKGNVIAGELEAERNLLKKVDLVIGINERLAQLMRERMDPARHLPIHLIPNFYDECMFNPDFEFDEPPGLKGVPHPRVLVAGHISDRIDWDGISEASRLRSQWTWVFLGRVADTGTKETIRSRLGAQGMLFPAVPYTEVPAWIRHCDTCAIPYRLNAFTLASDPLKAPEYLAMGASVMSTRVPALSRFGDSVYWVEEGNGGSYARALDEVAHQSGNNRLQRLRRRAAAPDSLAARADQFRTIILECLKPPLSKPKESSPAHLSAGGSPGVTCGPAVHYMPMRQGTRAVPNKSLKESAP
jgi:hypothetical protein